MPIENKVFEPMEKLLTVKDLCEYLQVSQARVYKWVNYCFIPDIKMGTSIRFKESQIESWVKKRERRGDPLIRLKR